MKELKHFINGKFVAGKGKRAGEIYNPATGKVGSKVVFATADDTRRAIDAAEAAFPGWAATPPARRAQVMFDFRDLIRKNMNELAALVSGEHGKTLADAEGSITRGLEVVEFVCGIPHLLKGEMSENVSRNIDSYSLRQPLGVCIGITPFNFPAMVPLWMFPVAIACGNTFVLKPSEKVPSTSLRLAELLQEAGLPDGVLNVLIGDKEAVDVLLTDDRVQAVSFVGSTPVGEYIYRTACAHGKRAQVLCGAKNHMVLMPDADLEKAVDAAMGAAYGSAGERCMAISVVVAVGDEIADRFIQQLVPRVKALKIGAYNDDGVEMGPLITSEHEQKVRAYVETGIKEGADLVVDGRNFKSEKYPDGFFLGGCLFDQVTAGMKIYQEEIFGPVLCVVRAKNFDEALRLVNDHEYGNGAAIFTRDGDAARSFVSHAKIGMIGVNVPIPVPVAYHSFGGWKRSLFGDHHMHGLEGVRFFTRLKTITSRWPSGVRSGAQFHFKSGADH